LCSFIISFRRAQAASFLAVAVSGVGKKKPSAGTLTVAIVAAV
jgi:hypothetical protein